MCKELLLAKQGEIWLVEFPPSKEVLIISGNIQNECDQWVEDIKHIEPFEVYIKNTKETGLDYSSKVFSRELFIILNKVYDKLCFIYPFAVDRERLKKPLGKTSREIMKKAKKAWKTAFEVEEW